MSDGAIVCIILVGWWVAGEIGFRIAFGKWWRNP
jgi:hypothetical protein